MIWNHRLMRRRLKNGYVVWAIHEVYYDEGGRVKYWTEDPVLVEEEEADELRETLERFMRAMSQPALDYETGKEIKHAQP